MSSKGYRRGLATNVLWKTVPDSGTCIHEVPLAELGMCPWHDIVRSGRCSHNRWLSKQSVQCLRYTIEILCCEWHASVCRVGMAWYRNDTCCWCRRVKAVNGLPCVFSGRRKMDITVCRQATVSRLASDRHDGSVRPRDTHESCASVALSVPGSVSVSVTSSVAYCLTGIFSGCQG